MKVNLEKVRHMVAKMMTEENDEHSQLLSDLKKRIDFDDIDDTIRKLSLIHEAKIKVLEEIYRKLNNI